MVIKAHTTSYPHNDELAGNGKEKIVNVRLRKTYLYVALEGNAGFQSMSYKWLKYSNQGFKNDNVTNKIDILVNDNTVYGINDKGLYIYDIQRNKYLENIIKLPYLKKLDIFVYQEINPPNIILVSL